MGCFYLKKTDNLRDFVDGLNQFYHAAMGNASGGVRKRKPKEINKEKDVIGGKKKKLEIKNRRDTRLTTTTTTTTNTSMSRRRVSG